ncbi:unnamed protein product [Rangifer tarandus platyrhynchus]|uniref:Uncharacterized protein n=1 Tax=Rangifer tarandus platyrhynchus TaxID=3082113 RepID=A0ABN8YTE6_RANTA|nr:unnamed protein product [Rangifer tarandus platyrhynchus]
MTTQGLCLPRRGKEPGHYQQETPPYFPSLLVLGHWGGGSRWSWAWAQVDLALWPQAKPRHQLWPPLWTLAPLSWDSCHLGTCLTLSTIPSILEAMCLGHSESGNTLNLASIFPTP